MLDLSNRPLLNTAADQQRFVGRDKDLQHLIRALGLRFNVLVVGARGVGTSSFLGRLAATQETDGHALPRPVWVRAGRVDSPPGLLRRAAEALAPDLELPEPLGEDDALRALVSATARHGPAVLIIDGLQSGRTVHGVFGRLRDELWQLADLRWVVGLDAAQEIVALTPPADQFFEYVQRLGPLSRDEVVEALRRRGADGELSPEVLDEVADASQGNPGVALRLARHALTAPAAPARPPASIVAEIAEELGAPAARLAGELASVGSSGPSDEGLLARLGWSRPRAYQVFQDLEAHGYVISAQERNGRPGRPRKIYRLRELSA